MSEFFLLGDFKLHNKLINTGVNVCTSYKFTKHSKNFTDIEVLHSSH